MSKYAAKPAEMVVEAKNQKIIMKTQPAEHIPGFIMANARCFRCGNMPAGLDKLKGFFPLPLCECDEPYHIPMIAGEGHRKGDSVLICGAGPSLKHVSKHLKRHRGEVWGCNSALTYLHENGHRVTHGVAIDPSNRMIEQWADPPDVEYLVATTVSPGLTEHLIEQKRRIRHFHSLRGAPAEIELYKMLYPATVLAGHGLNVVNRAVDVAAWLGFSEIKLVGVDSAFRGAQMYADGHECPHDDHVLIGEFDGREWRTRTDMLMSAVSLVRAKRRLKDKGQKLKFLGDCLPYALQQKPDDFLKRCIDWAEDDGRETGAE